MNFLLLARVTELKNKTMDYTKTTLGELLSHENETIRRNATSILKQLQRRKLEVKSDYLETHFVPEIKLQPTKKCTHDWDNYGKCTICGIWNY
jgi:hypothetical protein